MPQCFNKGLIGHDGFPMLDLHSGRALPARPSTSSARRAKASIIVSAMRSNTPPASLPTSALSNS